MLTSASIRYALDEEWLRIKGQTNRAEPVGLQYPKLGAA